MSVSEAMRKSALLASVMRSGQRRRLLASLPIAMAEQLRTQIALVRRHGWDELSLVEPLLHGQELTVTQTDADLGLEEIVRLSHILSAATLSRVVMATTAGEASFVLAALDPQIAKAVCAELTTMRPLPPALAAAVRNAAQTHAAAVPAMRALP
ncbi:hypothetical protein [Xanthomonas arboricola]|uniref:hypothetical protein n=1 Tax=Xanthomonas arboricola TaxID=56448 RepID=UPI001EE905A1|nr:hypothetical protein [Xanthomonas arboricola]